MAKRNLSLLEIDKFKTANKEDRDPQDPPTFHNLDATDTPDKSQGNSIQKTPEVEERNEAVQIDPFGVGTSSDSQTPSHHQGVRVDSQHPGSAFEPFRRRALPPVSMLTPETSPNTSGNSTADTTPRSDTSPELRAHSLRSYIPPSPSSTTSSSLSILNSLSHQPQFNSLQQALLDDVRASSSTVPHTLLPLSSSPLVPQRIPYSSREATLRIRFQQLQPIFPGAVSILQNYYNLQSASIESSRLSQLYSATATPWLKPSVDYYSDLQHHALIDNIEFRLQCLNSDALTGSAPLPASPLTPLRSHSVAAQSTPNKAHAHLNPFHGRPMTSRDYLAPTPPSSASRSSPANNPNPISPTATEVMENWYQSNMEHPYPSYCACQVMATAGHITVEQVKKWFANKRFRRGQTKPLTEIARRRKLPLDESTTPQTKKAKTSEASGGD